MSTHDEALKNSRHPQDPSDGSTRSRSISRPSNLPATTISSPENTLPGHRISTPNSPNASHRLSSPSVRALVRQNTVNQVQRQQSRLGASTQRAPIIDGTRNSATRISCQVNQPLVFPGHITATSRPALIQAGPSILFSNISRPSLVSIQKSKGPASRKGATPTKPFQQHQQRQSNNSAQVKPFQKLEALEVKLRTSPQGSKFSDDLRRLQLATTIHRTVKASLAQRPSIKQYRLPQQILVPDIKDLGLGQLMVVEDQVTCSFCSFECNYGCSNEAVLLPASASYHRCLDCQPTRLFDERYENAQLPQTSTSVSVLGRASNAPPGDQAAPQYQICESDRVYRRVNER
jgi:hypothetical protein